MSSRKIDVLARAKRAGLFDLARRRTASGIRILCYHGLWLGDDTFRGDSMFMMQKTFVRRLALLRREGYPTIALGDAIAALQGRGPMLPPAAVVITIDDGWASTYLGMLPALERHGMPATLFCDSEQLMRRGPVAHVMARYFDRIASTMPHASRQGSVDVAAAASRAIATDSARSYDERYAATEKLAAALGLDMAVYLSRRAFDYMTPEELRDAAGRGLDVQLHAHRHTLGDMSRAVIEDEISTNRQVLGDLLGHAPIDFKHFCYPSGVATPAAAGILASLGIESATTTQQGIARPGTAMHLLPRLLDGENLSEIEFEAEVSGFGSWLRRGRHLVRPFIGRDTRQQRGL